MNEEARIHAMQCRRLLVFCGLMVVALAGLGFRLVDLHILQSDQLQAEVDDHTQRTYLKEPRRGDIRDSKGHLLARSVFVKTLAADTRLTGARYLELAELLAPILEMDQEELAERLAYQTYTTSSGESKLDPHVVIKQRVPLDEVDRALETLKEHAFLGEESATIEEKKELRNLRRIGVFADGIAQQIRIYPNGKLASHVLGYVGVEERQTNRGPVQDRVGKAGIELVLDPALTGIAGWRSTEIDRRKEEVVAFRDQDVPARPGLNAFLTIDSGVQHIIEQELAPVIAKHRPVSATAIVVRPSTGEILGMATLPDYDPGDLRGTTADQRRNRAICDQIEPGSTFKIVPVTGALNEGLINLDTIFDCGNGRWMYAGRPLRDHVEGEVTVTEVISKSSNIGAAKIGLMLGEERLHRYMRAFGFGQKTDVSLVGEISGTVHPVEDWTKLSITRIPMGHEVAVTPLQMVMAMAAIGNEGRLMRPLVVSRLEDAEGRVVHETKPIMVRQVVEPRAARLMVEALKAVVVEGTAKVAQLEHYVVAGKTGTAQKPVDGHYPLGKYYSSFIGFFPADKPEVCIGVIVDEPDWKTGYYGVTVAAPVFQRMGERISKYLAISPDSSKRNEMAPFDESRRTMAQR